MSDRDESLLEDTSSLRVLSRAELEAAVSERTSSLQNVMDTMADILLKLDENGRITMANRALTDVLGYEDVEGKPLDFLFATAEDGQAEAVTHGDLVERLYADGRVTDVEVPFETVHGEAIPMSLSASVLREDDRVSGFVCVASDISEIRAREEEIRLLNELFGRVLRHNMRNELSAITMAAESLTVASQTDLDRIQETILSCSHNLLETGEKARLIADVIYEYDDRAMRDARSEVETAVDRVRAEYEDAVVETDVRVESAPCLTHEALDVAIENLVENGIVHNDGSAHVTVELDVDASMVVIRVRDDGPGIPEHEIEVLHRGEETALLHSSGAGLWLVDWIVRRSDGELTFDRIDGETVVTIRLRATAG